MDKTDDYILIEKDDIDIYIENNIERGFFRKSLEKINLGREYNNVSKLTPYFVKDDFDSFLKLQSHVNNIISKFDEEVEKISKIVYEQNKQFAISYGEDAIHYTTWDLLSKESKEITKKCVIYIAENFDTVTPERLHNEWRAILFSFGWKYGENKSVSDKIHPCLKDKSYHFLSDDQKCKDEIFISTTKILLKRIKF